MHRVRYVISRRMARVFPSVTRRPRVSLPVNPLYSTIHWWMVSTCGWKRPVHGVSGNANGAPTGDGPVIGVLLTAKSLSDVDATTLLLRALLLVSGVVTLVGTLIASWLIATRVLRPLSELMTTARSIAASTARGTRIGNLSQRVSQPRGHDEL